jgi:hypothetical protein
LIVSNINFVSGYRKQVRKICASLQTVYLRYNAKSIITVCNGPIVWAVTNFAVSESIFVLIHKGNTANLFIGISKWFSIICYATHNLYKVVYFFFKHVHQQLPGNAKIA